MNHNFKKYIINYIKENLEKRKCATVYGCDLAAKLIEYDSMNGSITCSAPKSRQFITEHWEEAEKVAGLIKEITGEPVDIFNVYGVEKFHIDMVYYGMDEILSESNYLNSHSDKKITLNDETIRTILDEIQ